MGCVMREVSLILTNIIVEQKPIAAIMVTTVVVMLVDGSNVPGGDGTMNDDMGMNLGELRRGVQPLAIS